MQDPSVGPVRALRALALVAAVLVPTIVGHVLGGGHGHPGAVVVLGVLLWPLALCLTRRQLRFPTLLGALAITQVGAHAVLTWLTPVTVGPPCAIGSAHQHAAVLTCTSSGPPVPQHISFVMVMAHVIALVVTVTLLAHGEAILWQAAHSLARLLLRSRPTARLAPRPVARPGHVVGATWAPQVVGGIVPARGPPVLSCA